MRTAKAIAAVLLLLTCTTLQAAMAGDIPDFRAEYDISYGFLTLGKAVRSLSSTDKADEKIYRSESKTTGLVSWLADEEITEQSRVRLMPRRVRSLHYQKIRIGKKNLDIRQQFDWKDFNVHSQVNDKNYDYPIPLNALDQNVYLFALMYDLSSKVQDLKYSLTENNRIRQYDIRILRREVIDTEMGEVDTLLIEHKSSKMHTRIWCASEAYYLPVKIKHSENGETYTAELQKLSGFTIPSN